MRKSNVHDKDNKCINVSYPVNTHPSMCMVNNKRAVLAFQLKQEKINMKAGVLDSYNAELQKYIDHGAIVLFSREELTN